MRHYFDQRFALMLSMCALVISHLAALPDAQPVLTAVEPPRRPDQFRTIDELNKYLAELRQYYTILGRPRFGRSPDRALGKRNVYNWGY